MQFMLVVDFSYSLTLFSPSFCYCLPFATFYFYFYFFGRGGGGGHGGGWPLRDKLRRSHAMGIVVIHRTKNMGRSQYLKKVL